MAPARQHPPPADASPEPSLTPAERRAAIARYEAFIAQRLQPDLRRALDAADAAEARAAEYAALRAQLARLEEDEARAAAHHQAPAELKLMTNLGRDFFARARVPRAALLCVDVGLGFHAELTRAEAAACAERHETALGQRARELAERAAAIRAHISVVVEALAELASAAEADGAREAAAGSAGPRLSG